MAELQKMIVQASNEAYKSDLMKSFVSDYKGQLSQSVGADPGYLGVSTGGGARFFAPASTLPPPSTTAAASSDTTDNANANVLLQGTDNVKSTDETNRNTINANRPTTTSSSTTTGSAAATTDEGPDTNANVSEVAAVLAEVRGAVPETKQVLVQQVTEVTAEAHRGTCINTRQAVQEARARFAATSSQQAAGCLPDMSKLSLSATAMWEKMKEQMMPELAKTITFFKQLPGFNELCLDDQMLLIKQGTFEVMMTRFAMLIDHEKNTMLDPSHKMMCPREVIQKMPMGEFLDGFFQVGASFNPIGLNDSEIGLFTAVLAFSPSRPGLKEPRLVSTIQSMYLQALFHLMKQSHSDAESQFSRVLGLVPMFRRMSEEHNKTLTTMKSQAPDDFSKQFTPIHKEMYVYK